MKTSNDKKTYWVTGASSGIGRAVSLQLAAEGHTVVISSRSKEKLEAIASEYPQNLIPLACDITNDEQMAALFQPPFNAVDTIDCAILSAGICEYIDYPALDIESIRRVSNTNFFGTVNSCIAVLPLLRKTTETSQNNKGHIVGLSSLSCYVGFPRAEAYGSSKAALSYFLESLRTDIQPDIDVTVVYPGFVSTPMTQENDFPMPFQITPDEAARIIIDKIKKRPARFAFPWRLHFLLKLAATFSGFWYKTVTPYLSRSQKVKS